MIGATKPVAQIDAPFAGAAAIVQPGKNCWRVDRAQRFYCVQDAACYFRLVRQAILGARQTVFILGWDIMAKLDMLPGEPPSEVPSRLDELLAFVSPAPPSFVATF